MRLIFCGIITVSLLSAVAGCLVIRALLTDENAELIRNEGGRLVCEKLLTGTAVIGVSWTTGSVTDKQLPWLSDMTVLETLDLGGNAQITDDGLSTLAAGEAKPYLLNLTGTSVSEAGISRYLTVNPKCDVNWQGRWWNVPSVR